MALKHFPLSRLALVLIIPLLAAELLAQQTERTIKGGRGTGPLADKILQSEKSVTVVDSSDAPFTVHMLPGKSPVPVYVGASSVLVIRSLALASRLTETKDWVVSDWRIQIEDIVRLGLNQSFKKNEVIAVPQDGGEIQIGATRVLVRKPWASPLRSDARYLVIVNVSTEGISIHPTQAYRITEDGRLEGRVSGVGLDGMLIEQVIREARALK